MKGKSPNGGTGTDVLNELSIKIVGDSPERFLASGRFETCLSAQEVHAIALGMQAVVEDVGKHDAELGRELTLKVGRVFERGDDATWIEHHRVIMASAALVLEGVTLHSTATLGIPSIVSDEEFECIEEQRKATGGAAAETDVSRTTSEGHLSHPVSVSRHTCLQVQKLLAGLLTPLEMGHIAVAAQGVADLSGGPLLRRPSPGRRLESPRPRGCSGDRAANPGNKYTTAFMAGSARMLTGE